MDGLMTKKNVTMVVIVLVEWMMVRIVLIIQIYVQKDSVWLWVWVMYVESGVIQEDVLQEQIQVNGRLSVVVILVNVAIMEK